MKIFKKFSNWFDLKFGWFFCPPSKQGKEHRYLKNKDND